MDTTAPPKTQQTANLLDCIKFDGCDSFEGGRVLIYEYIEFTAPYLNFEKGDTLAYIELDTEKKEMRLFKTEDDCVAVYEMNIIIELGVKIA